MERKSFKCSYNRIELIITYKCNLRCINCDAMVSQAPSSDSMTVDQIKKFIEETIKDKIEWKHIRVLGGEPTIHNNFLEIMELIGSYKINHSPNTRIQVVTNGYAPTSNKIIEKLPKYIEIENSNKKGSFQPQFAPINEAPIDSGLYSARDFSKGCWIPALCGIALDMNGYYPCSAAAAFDRVSGYGLGKKQVPQFGELEKLFKVYCKMCGHFTDKVNSYATEDVATPEALERFEKIHTEKFPESFKDNNYQKTIYSKSWVKIMDKYKKEKPTHDKY